ncbi:hypothetical protein F0562_017724 [Nyssa sinensis]|uniref:Uncharacterized protein n=1 Tax=Nyssa sinensis TaxID=561372 RepID=A0A5J4ZJN8_9ASTE|nr:hypothetical protein F0562_017724 [Nyssa sinensis]
MGTALEGVRLSNQERLNDDVAGQGAATGYWAEVLELRNYGSMFGEEDSNRAAACYNNGYGLLSRKLGEILFTKTVEFDSSWATTAMAVAAVATGGGFTGLRITERIEDEIRGLRGGDSS